MTEFVFDVFWSSYDEVKAGRVDAYWSRVVMAGADGLEAESDSCLLVMTVHPDTMVTRVLARV